MSDLGAWEPFSVADVGALMRGAPCSWWLSGGYAIDRIAGRVVRPHGDIDISAQADHWPLLARHVASRLECFLARDGKLSPITDTPRGHNIWAREPGGTAWRLQINLEPVVSGEWRYRRDEHIRLPFADAVDGGETPCVRAAVQLLWKSKDAQRKDELDFDAVIHSMPEDERTWLTANVQRAHPESPWNARLAQYCR